MADLPGVPEQRRGPDDIIRPGDPNFTMPTLSQQVNMSEALQRNFEALATLSSQISRNLGGTGQLLEHNVSAIDRMTRGTQRLNIETRQQADQYKDIMEFQQKREEIIDRIRNAERGTGNELRNQFQLGGMLHKQKIAYLDEEHKMRTISIEQYRNMSGDEKAYIRESLAGNIAQQQAGRASISQALSQLFHGNVAGALSELGQSAPGLGNLRARLQMRSAGLNAAAAERIAGASGEGAGFAGALGGRLSGGLLRVGGSLFGLGALATTGGGIAAGVYGARRALGEYQQLRSAGQQTGEGGFGAFREGAGAQLKAIGEGINPFDALSLGAARAIARGIQSEGFSGEIRAAWQDSVTDVVKHTGMDSGEALSLMSTAVNQFSESSKEFDENMRLMKDVAHDTNISIKQAAEGLQQFQQQFAPLAGSRGAEAVVPGYATLAKAAPGAIKRGTLLPSIAQNWQRLVALAGLNPADAWTDRVTHQMSKILDINGKKLWEMKNSNPVDRRKPLEQWVQEMEGRAPGIFEVYLGPGASAQDVIGFMRAVGPGGKGLETVQRTSVNPAQRRAKTRAEWFPPNADIGGNTGLQKLIYIGRLQKMAKDDDLSPAQVRKIAQPIWQTKDNLPAAYEKSKELLEQIEGKKQVGRQNLRTSSSAHPSQMRYQLPGQMGQDSKVIIDLTHDAKKILKVSEYTEPAARQRYHDSRRGAAGTQGMDRP